MLRPGRGELLKQQCPVSSCVITTNRCSSSSIEKFMMTYFITLMTTMDTFDQLSNHNDADDAGAMLRRPT